MELFWEKSCFVVFGPKVAWNGPRWLQWHKDLKLTHTIFFGKNFILYFLSQKGPKMNFFKLCKKSLHETVLILCMRSCSSTKAWNSLNFFGEKSPTEVFGQKEAQNEFFKIYNRSMNWIFLIFCIKLQEHNGWKLGKTDFAKFLF